MFVIFIIQLWTTTENVDNQLFTKYIKRFIDHESCWSYYWKSNFLNVVTKKLKKNENIDYVQLLFVTIFLSK